MAFRPPRRWFGLIHWNASHILNSLRVRLNRTVDEMVQLITGGDMLMLRCENPLPLLFDSCCDGVE